MKKHTLCCLMQNRLGALDRVLGALTYRGFLPEQLFSTADTGSDRLQLMVTFTCDDEHTVEKLVKYLQKQVYVLNVSRVLLTQPEAEPMTRAADNIAHLFNPETTQRRLAHAHHS